MTVSRHFPNGKGVEDDLMQPVTDQIMTALREIKAPARGSAAARVQSIGTNPGSPSIRAIQPVTWR